MEYSVYSKFDIAKHKETFIEYLEVMISRDGEIMYAVPSHQEAALALAAKALDMSRETVIDVCPPEYYYDYMRWLLMQSGAIAVWNCMCVIGDSISKAQIAALRALKLNGLYHGTVPKL
jgi:hypothetical protein